MSSKQPAATKTAGGGGKLRDFFLYVRQHWQLYVLFILPAFVLTIVFQPVSIFPPVKWYVLPPITAHALSMTPFAAKWYFAPSMVCQPVSITPLSLK